MGPATDKHQPPTHQLKLYIRALWGLTDCCAIKGMLLSKALTNMKCLLYKQMWLLYQGDGSIWLYCCMNNLYISHRSFCTQTYSFWALSSMLISRFWVTSWFYSVYNIVTLLVNFREKHLQLSNYNMGKYFRPIVQISGWKLIFSIFAYKFFMVKKQNL